MKKYVSLVVATIISLVLIAQELSSRKFSPYTKLFTAVKGESSSSEAKAKSLFKTKEIGNKSYVSVFIRLKDGDDLDSLRAAGVVINSQINHIVTGLVPADKLDEVGSLSNVTRLEMGVPVYKRMDKARLAANVDSVQLGNGLSHSYKGKGVVIGIVDQGFQYGHVNFYNTARDTLRVKRVWNQSDSTGVSPTNFSYGSEYTTSSAILSAAYDTKSEIHATHVAGIAAGSDSENKLYGVAPEADLVFVSYNDDVSTSLLDGVKYVYDYATEVSKPAVVNLSLGTHIGPHDGTSTFDQACDELEGAGRLLVGAAGNEGGDSLYIHKAFSSSTDTLKTFFKFVDSSTKIAYADIWGLASKSYKVALGVYDTSTKKYKTLTSFYDASQTYNLGFSLSSSGSGSSSPVGKLYIYTEKNTDNNKANAFVYATMSTLPSSQYICLLITASEGSIDAWSGDSYATFDSYSQSGWTTGSSISTVGEIGGTGKKIISVGAYSTKKTFTNLQNTSYSATSLNVGDIAYFSSKGPTIDGRMKPDIAAPGAIIASSFSSAQATSSTYSYLRVAKTTFNATTYYYGIMQGTSMASPFVTGVLATWLQANPSLTPADVRTILQKTAINDAYTDSVRSAGSDVWGYGKIDAWKGIKQIISDLPASANEDQDSSELFSYTQSGTSFTLTFLRDAENVVVSCYSVTGKQVFRKTISNVSEGDKSSFDLTGLARGVYILQVTATDAVRTNKKVYL